MKDATTDLDQITRWWKEWPDANIGIATGAKSGIVAIDVDNHRGRDGHLSLEHLQAEHGRLPDTVCSLTGGGGQHLIFLHPGHPVRDQVAVWPGIDVRGDGGYIVAPPSLHVAGKTYKFEASGSPDDVPLAPLPTWLLEEIRGRKRNGTRPQDKGGGSGNKIIREGERNVKLTSMAGAMRATGFGQPAIAAALHLTNEESCRPPLPDDEVDRIAASVNRYPDSVPRTGGLYIPRELLRRTALWRRPRDLRVLLHLLCEATWREEDRGAGGLGRGEVRTSLREIAATCEWVDNNRAREWKHSSVQRTLDALVRLGLIEQTPEPGLGTLIKVLDYQQYQGVPVSRT